ncbi:hypothetical protein TNCV_3903911 [Trichonephila clavipes]|nr:hypothetical protein TNCV_3903911 [Trichonephila clavipes]
MPREGAFHHLIIVSYPRQDKRSKGNGCAIQHDFMLLTVSLTSIENLRNSFANIKEEAIGLAKKWGITPEFEKKRQKKLESFKHLFLFMWVIPFPKIITMEGYITLYMNQINMIHTKLNSEAQQLMKERPIVPNSVFVTLSAEVHVPPDSIDQIPRKLGTHLSTH